VQGSHRESLVSFVWEEWASTWEIAWPITHLRRPAVRGAITRLNYS
jgi:hypothetical protein